MGETGGNREAQMNLACHDGDQVAQRGKSCHDEASHLEGSGRCNKNEAINHIPP
jgi:hypothetical protein